MNRSSQFHIKKALTNKCQNYHASSLLMGNLKTKPIKSVLLKQSNWKKSLSKPLNKGFTQNKQNKINTGAVKTSQNIVVSSQISLSSAESHNDIQSHKNKNNNSVIQINKMYPFTINNQNNPLQDNRLSRQNNTKQFEQKKIQFDQQSRILVQQAKKPLLINMKKKIKRVLKSSDRINRKDRQYPKNDDDFNKTINEKFNFKIKNGKVCFTCNKPKNSLQIVQSSNNWKQNGQIFQTQQQPMQYNPVNQRQRIKLEEQQFHVFDDSKIFTSKETNSVQKYRNSIVKQTIDNDEQSDDQQIQKTVSKMTRLLMYNIFVQEQQMSQE